MIARRRRRLQVFGTGAVRVWIAVAALEARGDRPTARKVGRLIGRSASTVHVHLVELAALGAVAGVGTRGQGTLHSTARPVPILPPEPWGRAEAADVLTQASGVDVAALDAASWLGPDPDALDEVLARALASTHPTAHPFLRRALGILDPL